ncbi:Ger(x)C family spore germination protein [Bacillus thuringiensis]|uniref:Spore gernimation protein XA n=1 Tax=Bacillus thuringiensis TaxID=1428 RepID=A0A9W3TBW5_BACTU|nr:Ger(x)C family spore germination protein [Bacillus thuringiensis]AQY38392.1 spore gernimation protein XA [Bacillus thuringiensis]KIP26679.1 germination, Ger(x)C family protein [Bacillus thuringiensis serovar morrisoni]MCT6946965.1 Ger(x)C family spore germination protein [Bacillus thuringiensis]MDR4150716.1 Ger(x)C family spore germination protein [Bacillus thuringiensis]MEC3572217.1 Ger(x)C family spore germination protein [Bacillus thuringiensis]
MIWKKTWILITCICLVACGQRIPLEKASLILLIALDKTTDGEIKVGASIPLFHHKEKRSTVEHWVHASTVYNGLSKIERRLTGYVTPSKAEIILIGRKFAQENNWFQSLDSSFRDPSAALNAKVLIVEGKIEELLQVKRPDKPLLVSYINDVINTSIHSNQSVPSSVQQLLREQNESGMTQTIPIIKTKRNLIITEGIVFLSQNGKYLTKLSKEDVKVFNLINKANNTGRTILHFSLPKKNSNQPLSVSVLVQDAKRKINIDYQKDQFIFNIDVYLDISLIEKVGEEKNNTLEQGTKNTNLLKKQIKNELNTQLISMFRDIQKNKIDPVGLSVYAKAYQYKEWKQAERNWLEQLSKAKININTHIKIKDTGTFY